MHFSLNMVPVPQWIHREFDGVDPWAGNKPVRWSVVVYALLSETFVGKVQPEARTVPGDSNAVPDHLAVGISGPGGQYRILPLALQDLWRAGKVRDQQLPTLLHRVEDKLKPADYPPDRGSCVGLAVGVFSVLVFLASFAYSLFTPAKERIIAFTESAQWLAEPIEVPRQVYMHQPIKLVVVTPIVPPVLPPSGVKTDGYHRNERALLAVIEARQEKRLALVSAVSDLDNPAGVVLRSSSLRVPGLVFAGLKQRFQDLNTDYVLCVGWNRTDALSPADVESYSIAKQFMFFCGPLALLCFLPVARRRYRRRKQAHAWLRLLESDRAVAVS